MKHTVIGAGGQAGRHLVSELLSREHEVIAVARRWDGQPFGADVEYRIADAMSREQLTDALADSSTAYATLGLPYTASVWEAHWPTMTKNVCDAALDRDARLIYLDNVYAYGPVSGWMTEQTPYRATSRKGRARARAASLLADAIGQRQARIIIARAADFFGPGGEMSIIGPRFFKGVLSKTSAKRRVEWLGDPNTRHCYNSLTDIAAALVTLGEADESDFGQTWHLPTNGPMTGHELCATLGQICQCTVIPRPLGASMIRLAGLFNPLVREQLEMLYQFTSDYLFSDQKFKTRFPDFHQQPFAEALDDTLQYFSARRIGPRAERRASEPSAPQ